MRYLAVFLVILGLSGAAWAQQAVNPFYRALPSTPDIAVGGTSQVTLDILAFLGAPPSWVYLKNDCADAIYFDLRGNRDASANDFPLRLGQGEVFQLAMPLTTLAASHGQASTASCTFTLMLAR